MKHLGLGKVKLEDTDSTGLGYLDRLHWLISFKIKKNWRTRRACVVIWKGLTKEDVISISFLCSTTITAWLKGNLTVQISFRRCHRCPSPRSPWRPPRTGPPRCRATTPVRRWLPLAAPGTPYLTTRYQYVHLEHNSRYFRKLYTMFEFSPVWRCRALCLWRRRRSWRSRARTTWTSSSQSTRARSRSCKVGQLNGEGDRLVGEDCNRCLNVWKGLSLNLTRGTAFLHNQTCEDTELV